MELVKGKSLGELAEQAQQACKHQAVMDLILHGSFPYEEAESVFVKMNEEIASKWQNPTKPDELRINHGEYINRFGDGKEFLVEELKRKLDSNRACLSLLNMKDIIGSGDDPRPSFLILQFGFSESNLERLIVTAYFRSLEVSQFLPINLSEITQYVRFFKTRFPQIKLFEMTIIAFRAHSDPRFDCHRKAIIDAANPGDIVRAVERNDVKKIREWIDSKTSCNESAVCTDGLERLFEALMACERKYEKTFMDEIRQALDSMRELKEVRKSSSHIEYIKELNNAIRKRLLSAREKIA